MGKTYLESVKYMIKCEFEIRGPVDKPDIIGAVFGQSEGLLGEELDLRELQKNGRIGRIDITNHILKGKTRGKINIPTSLDMAETSILAAAVESVDKVGPFEARFETKEIEDTRTIKREEITSRAKELLNRFGKGIPGKSALAEKVREDARTADVKEIGSERLAAGPGIMQEDSIIVVEGRADVINLLKNGIKNVIEMGGAKPARTTVEMCRKKEVILFVDGDRGGELNIRNLTSLTNVNFVARAPDGKEVEELERKEIIMALRRKVPAAQAMEKPFQRKAQKEQEEEQGEKTGYFRPRQQSLFGEKENAGPEKTREGFDRERTRDRRTRRDPRDRRGRETGREPKRQESRFKENRPGFGSRREEGFQKREPEGRFPRNREFGGRREDRGFGERREQRQERPQMRGGFERKLFREDTQWEPRERQAEPAPFEPRMTEEQKQTYEPIMNELKGSLKARLFDENMKQLAEIEVRSLLDSMKKYEKAKTIVFDGIVTNRVVSEAKSTGVENIVGIKKGKIENPGGVSVLTLSV